MDNDKLDALFEKIKQNESSAPEAVGDFINQNLSPDQAQALNRILSDKETVSRLLATEQAHKLLEKFALFEKRGD